MSDEVLAAVTRQITELSGRMALAHADLQRMRADLAVLDATVRLFSPELAKPSRRIRANRTAEHAGISRAVLDTLRLASQPLTTFQVAALCHVDPSRALATLRYQQKNGTVQSGVGPGQSVVWRIDS